MSADSRRPAAPRGTKAAGRRLWNDVLDEYELDEHELTLLVQAVRTIDHLELLDAAVRRDGVTVSTAQGNSKPHPALVESRHQRIALARLLAALRLPSGDEADGRNAAAGRPQRRVGVRGTYGITGVVS